MSGTMSINYSTTTDCVYPNTTILSNDYISLLSDF